MAYDSLPAKCGRMKYLEKVLEYIKTEYRNINNGAELKHEAGDWQLHPCYKGDGKAPHQDGQLHNCAIYTSLFMEILVNKKDPLLLNECKSEIENHGRFALWQSIQLNRPIFHNCTTRPQQATNQHLIERPKPLLEMFPLSSSSGMRRTSQYCDSASETDDENTTSVPATLPVLSDSSGPFQYEQLNRTDTPFIEEINFHTPVTKPMPIPWPFKFTKPNVEDSVEWKYDKELRLVTVNFSQVGIIKKVHKVYLGELMERDDITVVCEGLLPCKLDTTHLLEELIREMGDEYYPKFRRFDKRDLDGVVTYHERTDGHVSMKVEDYVRHLTILMGDDPSSKSFSYKNQSGVMESFEKATDSLFYMLDVTMAKYMRTMLNELTSRFKLKEILPGGEWCLFQYVSTSEVAQ